MDVDLQQDRARRWRRRLIGSATLLAFLAALFLFSLVATDPGDNVTLVETDVETRGVDRYVTGALRNNTDDTYSRIRIEISLLDKDGSIVESMSATMLDLAADERRTFEAVVVAHEAVRYRVDGLTCDWTPEGTNSKGKSSCHIPADRNRPPFAGDL